MQTMGVGNDCDIDHLLENQTQRFQQYAQALDRLAQAMNLYMETSQSYMQASAGLSHAFSYFFEVQLRDCTTSDPTFTQTRSLAQGALRLEEVHQSLRADIFAPAQQMQASQVLQSMNELKRHNADINHQMQVLKQKLIDYDSLRRTASSQKKNTIEFEKASQRAAAAEIALVGLTADINQDLKSIKERRHRDMRNELLTVIACQLFIHSRSKEHFEQLLPFLPGIARPLAEITQYSYQRPRCNPSKVDVIGVLSYEENQPCGIIDHPIYYQSTNLLDICSESGVDPIASNKSFKDMHLGQFLAAAAYGDHASVDAMNSARVLQNVRGGMRGMSSMAETAMITNDGSHVFVRKGWEFPTYMGIFGAPLLVIIGLANKPETDPQVLAREEARTLRKHANE